MAYPHKFHSSFIQAPPLTQKLELTQKLSHIACDGWPRGAVAYAKWTTNSETSLFTYYLAQFRYMFSFSWDVHIEKVSCRLGFRHIWHQKCATVVRFYIRIIQGSPLEQHFFIHLPCILHGTEFRMGPPASTILKMPRVSSMVLSWEWTSQPQQFLRRLVHFPWFWVPSWPPNLDDS